MRVFILQVNSKYDVSAAKAYGHLIWLVDEYLNPFDTDKFISTVKRQLYDVNKFDAKKDVICLTGSSILVALFLAIVAHHHKNVSVLLFDAETNKYKLRILSFGKQRYDK